MKYILFILLVISLCMAGCNSKDRTMEPSAVVDFPETGWKTLSEDTEDTFFDDPVFIKLKSADNNTLFGRIDQVKIVDDKIYMLDKRQKSLIVCGMDGNTIGRVGLYGQGPQEYLDIASFDIDKSGTIYTIDGRLDKLFVYDNNRSYISSVKLPFEVDQIQVLENGNYMFALSSWNRGECEGKKIAITDKNLHVLKSELEYDEYVDDNYWISGYQFIKTNNYIIYNKPIDNNIYFFSLEGELLKSIQINFGDRNVADEMKKDIERNITEFDNYCLLKNFVVATSQFIAGTLWDGRQSKMFILDNQHSDVYVSNIFKDSDNTLFTGFSNSTMISFIDPDNYDEYPGFDSLPSDVTDHIKNGDFVLCLKHTLVP